MAVNQFLIEMDGIESSLANIFVIGATNAPWDMDPALKRSGRFSKAIYIPPPDYATRVALFKFYTKDMPIKRRGFGAIDFGRLARATMGYASVDIKQICYEAGLIPLVEEYIKGKGREIKMSDFLKAIKKTKSSLDEWYMHVRKEIISKREVQIVDGKKTEIEKEGLLTPQERALYDDMIKDVKRNTWLPYRILKKIVRFIALYLF
jgi:SpoVK/Ycf46/Vps4 family AAA+-type ATPase